MHCSGTIRTAVDNVTVRSFASIVVAILLVASAALGAGANLVINPGFEAPLTEGWQPFWSRTPGAGEAVYGGPPHSGRQCLHVRYQARSDWSLSQANSVAARRGDILALSAWAKCDGEVDNASVSLVTRDSRGSVLDWQYGIASTSGTHDWEHIGRRVVVPNDCTSVTLRLTGSGPGQAWFDNISLTKEGNVSQFKGSSQEVRLKNALISAVFDAESGTLAVTDLRAGNTYHQRPLAGSPIVQHVETSSGGLGLTARLWDPGTRITFELRLSIAADRAEVKYELAGKGSLSSDIAFPAPFIPAPGSFWVLPMNEGLLYPPDEPSLQPLRLPAYEGGDGLSMPWFGLSQGETGPGFIAIIETPDDMTVAVDRLADGSVLCARPIWEPSRGALRYARVIRYCFLATGGYVAQAKRYREYAKEAGLYRSLRDKQKANPNVGLLIGAVNVWALFGYDFDKVALVKEMQALGIERILWSAGGKPEEVTALNAIPGVLTSRYDIYQDVYPPGQPTDAEHEGWPDALVLRADGSHYPTWVIRDSGKRYPGSALCSRPAFDIARRRIREDLARTPYKCRFLDVTTAAAFRECYDPKHPESRSDDRHWKMELLRFCSGEMGLVTGSETGIDPAVPYVDYFEGMLSLARYRTPDSGYKLLEYEAPTDSFLKFQVGPFYRVPLWELVYHDCVVSQWYWGDSTNKVPEVWDQRDLIDLLYGAAPLFMLNREIWEKYRHRFMETYRRVGLTIRRIGYDEMVSHEFLTRDHTLQRTTWSSGVSVIVNFAECPQRLSDGVSIPALGSLVIDGPGASQ